MPVESGVRPELKASSTERHFASTNASRSTSISMRARCIPPQMCTPCAPGEMIAGVAGSIEIIGANITTFVAVGLHRVSLASRIADA
jgi:hypothetical protein